MGRASPYVVRLAFTHIKLMGTHRDSYCEAIAVDDKFGPSYPLTTLSNLDYEIVRWPLLRHLGHWMCWG